MPRSATLELNHDSIDTHEGQIAVDGSRTDGHSGFSTGLRFTSFPAREQEVLRANIGWIKLASPRRSDPAMVHRRADLQRVNNATPSA
jgi:hypothetical protein